MSDNEDKPGIGSDGKFHVPSNYDPARDPGKSDTPDTRERWRIGLGMLVHILRGDELLVEVDFTDFAISGSIVDQANRDNYLNQIKIDGPVIAMKASIDSGQGGFKAGDIFRIDMATGTPEAMPIHRQVLTEEDIELIKKRLESEPKMAPNNLFTTSPE